MSEKFHELISSGVLLDDDAVFVFNEFKQELAGDSLSEVDSMIGFSEETFDLHGEQITVEMVHSEGGHEGGGDHVERVIRMKVKGIEFYIRFTGFYASYEGTDFDDGNIERVYPREVTVTQYFTQP